MRSILAFIALFALYVAVRAADINAASASRADVLTAYNSASDGDRIFVPAGSNNWSSAITVTKRVQLIGAGTNSTILVNTTSAGSGLETPFFNLQNNHISVSGFYFADSGLNWDSEALEVSGMGYQFIIKSNLFTGFNFGIKVWDAFGLCYSNHFLNNDVCLRVQGFDNTNEFSSFGSYPPFGPASTNIWMMEDNWVQHTSWGRDTYYSDTEFPALYGWRHNTFEQNVSSGFGVDGFDMHGTSAGSGRYVPVGLMIYKNTITKTGASGVDIKFVDLRGGAYSLVYSNSISGEQGYNYIRDDNSGTAGVLQTNVFLWANSDASGDLVMDYSGANGNTEGVNYFLYATNATVLAYPHPWRNEAGGGGGGSSSGSGKTKPGSGKGRRR